MRIRKRAHLKRRTAALFILSLVPFSFMGYYVYLVSHIFNDLTSFQYEVLPEYKDPSLFIEPNFTRLGEMARYYDQQFERYHLPLNYTTMCYFADDNLTEPQFYGFTDNGALWTGISMVAWVFHYLTALNENNTREAEYCLGVIRRMISGMAMMLIVPNGGLGPEYGGILARGWAAPEDKDIAPLFFRESLRHFNGTGNYSNYRWRGFTSNDEHGGYYMGLALALKYVKDPYVQETVSKMIEQLANYMVKTNFLGISGPGSPSGVDQKPKFGTGGFWVPLLLKMASIVNPEKYQQLYYRYVAEEEFYLHAAEGGPQETLSNYYAYNFGHAVVMAFLLLEGTESAIGRRYYKGYLNSLRYFTRYHRNAWFNIIYLLTLPHSGDLAKGDGSNITLVEKDILDQLMRFDINHFPDTYQPLKEVPEDYPKLESVSYWYNFLTNSSWGKIYSIPFLEFRFHRTYYKRPLTVEYLSTGMFMWEGTPFATSEWQYVNLHYEAPGVSFTVPFWIARYLGIIPEGGEHYPLEV